MPARALPQPHERHHRKKPGPPHLVLRQSAIDTEGCYTLEPIKKGDFVVEYTGRRLTVKQAEALYDKHLVTYLFGLDDGKHIIDGEGVAAFINHSCDPNCEADEVKGRILISAIRDIAAGEELTYDYNLYDGEPDDPATCSCGAKNCRGTMYSEDEIKRRERALRRKKRATSAKKKQKKTRTA